jgi:hypothetical protein
MATGNMNSPQPVITSLNMLCGNAVENVRFGSKARDWIFLHGGLLNLRP